MQACEGYFENNRFFQTKGSIRIPDRRRVVITVLDEHVQDDDIKKRVAALDEFFEVIKNCNEPVPEFERVKFNREVDI